MNLVPEPTRIPIIFNDGVRDRDVVAGAMSAARAAQPRWAATTLACRLMLVRELRRLIAENACALAETSADSRGRPVVEALTAEVLPLVEACRFLEREAETILAVRRPGRRGVPVWLAGIRTEIHRDPVGVVLIIGAGNYPLLLAGVQMIQALVAGNAVLLKPGSGGTAATARLRELMVRAGFDPDLIGLLPESVTAVRAAIAVRPDKVLFTGSAGTGEKILEALASQLIPATLELSGCDAVLVRADADLDLAAMALRFGLELNGGATCLSPKRVLVARSIATELEGRLAHNINPTSGHWIMPATVERLRPLLEDALAGGAHFVAGGIRADGTIAMPAVLAGVSPSARLLQEDIFAPVLALVTVKDDQEALMQANACPFGLGTAIFTRDEPAALALARRIQTGVVTINDLIVPTADARLPFGGRKRSGFGVTRGAEGLLELTVPKVITSTRRRFRPALERPQPTDQQLFLAYLNLVHGIGWKSRGAALISLILNLFQRHKPLKQETT